MAGVRDYSPTAASNLSVGGISIAEGWARASVNNAYREGMKDISNLLLDLGGATVTTGSSSAYLVALDSAPTAYADNLLFLATSHATNASAATINVNGVGVKPLKKSSMGIVEAFTGGEFPVGHVGIFIYSSSNNAVLMLNAATSVLIGANFGFFENRAAAEAAHIPASLNMIETLSFATPGDGGGARYKRIATPTYTYLGDFEDAGGGWWQHAPSGALRTAEYGVVGGASVSGAGVWSGTDAEPAIRDALYQHAYKMRGGPAELPIGNLFIGRGIHLGYGDIFRGAHLRGAHKGLNYQPYPATTLVWNFTDEPVISIQGGRSTIVEDVSFSGPGREYLLDNNIGSITYNEATAGDDTLLATWTDPTWLPQATSRYAPSVIIAVDPRVGPASSPYFYRDVDYPDEMGAVAQYGKGLSSNVTIQNFNVYGGAQTAIVVHPNENSDGNGDFVRIRNANIFYVGIGLSIGNSQARLSLLDSVDFARVHTCFTTNTHGKQTGTFAAARNCHFSGIQIFNIGDMSLGGTIVIDAGYGEELWRIGDFGSSTAAATKMLITQCKLEFSSQDASNRGVPATMIGGASGPSPLEIDGGYWGNYHCAVIDKDVHSVRINGLSLEPIPATTLQHKCFHNGTMGSLIFPQLGFGISIENINPKFVPWDFSTGSGAAARVVGDVWPSNRNICTPLWIQRHGETVRRDEGVFIPERVDAVVAGSTFTSPSMSGLTLTTTWAGRSDRDYVVLGPQEGDILFHPITRSTFVCMSANQTTDIVTWRLLNNYKNSNVVRDPINFLSDSLFYMGNLRYYSPHQAFYGIITEGSSVITDCGIYHEGYNDNDFQNGTSMSTYLAVGDYLIIDRDLEPYIGTNANTRITAINGAGNTLTIAEPAGAKHGTDGRRVRLGTFVRPGVF